MASTIPFRAISFAPDQLLDQDTLTQLSTNMNVLRDYMPQVRTELSSGYREQGVKILAGKQLIQPDSEHDDASITVRFSKIFSPGSSPVVTATLNYDGRARIFHRISGIGNYQPDDTGFRGRITVAADKDKNDKINTKIYFNWIAIGV